MSITASNFLDGPLIKGNLSIVPGECIGDGLGQIEVLGGIFTNNVNQFNSGNTVGVLIEGSNFYNGNFVTSIITAGSITITGSSLFIGGISTSTILSGGSTTGSLFVTGGSSLNNIVANTILTGGLVVTGSSLLNNVTISNSVILNITTGNIYATAITTPSININTINFSPSFGDIIIEQSFLANNNQNTPANVTGLLFSNSIVRSFNAMVSVSILADTNKYGIYNLIGIQQDSRWILNSTFVGDNTKIVFSITSSGQIQYTSSNLTGYISNTMKFKAQTLSK